MERSILLVDDEEMVTKSLQKLLEKKGYDVTVANDGREAVELNKSRDGKASQQRKRNPA